MNFLVMAGISSSIQYFEVMDSQLEALIDGNSSVKLPIFESAFLSRRESTQKRGFDDWISKTLS